MIATCRLLLVLAFTGWIYTGCEPHSLSETGVLHEKHGHGHHGDDHGHGDDHKHDDHGPAKGGDQHHSDDHKGKKGAPGKGEAAKGPRGKAEKGSGKAKETPKEEPRNLGL